MLHSWTFARVSRSLSIRNRRWPVVSSQRTTPSAKMSVRRSIASPCTCSGDMYASLPLSVPARVLDMRDVNFAIPKSTTFVVPSYVTKRLCGVTSRWIRFSFSPFLPSSSCAALRPSAASAITRQAISGGIGAPSSSVRRMTSRSGSPCRYSIAIQYVSSCLPSSKTDATFGCEIRAAIRASSRNIWMKLSSSTRCGWMRLMATHFWNPPGPSMRARWTLAIPPMPISSTTRYRPRK